MSEYLAILADIVAKMKEVPGVGLVHDYERQAKTLAEFIALFKDPVSGKILGWEITRRAVPEHQRGGFWRHHQFVLKGYMGLQDASASSKEFQALVDEVCGKFRRAEPGAPGARWFYRNGDDPNSSPAQVESINDRMFGNVLCHCAEIALSVTEQII